MATEPRESNTNAIVVAVALIVGALLAAGFLFRFPW
jgi:hypothetical protein